MNGERQRNSALPAGMVSRAIYRAGNYVVLALVALDFLVLTLGSTRLYATKLLCAATSLTLLSERPWPAAYARLATGICRQDSLIPYEFWRLWRAFLISTGFEAGVLLLVLNLRPLSYFVARGLQTERRHGDRPQSQGRALIAVCLFTLFIPCCYAIGLPTRLGGEAGFGEGVPALVLDTAFAAGAVLLPSGLSVFIAYYLIAYSPIGKVGQRPPS